MTGRVIIGSEVPLFHTAAIHIRLEDVSFADRPASLLTETILRPVAHDPLHGDTAVAFELRTAAPVESDHHYAVRVWVDADGDGVARPGDLHSDEAYPVLTRGAPSDIIIKLGSG